ncbi:MAG TPA: hypothetical protein VF263_03700 [Longimicrobiaceae bacterium]
MARVEIDIFSGRPNPVFELDEREAKQILRELSANPNAVTPRDHVVSRLGYRGLVLELDPQEAERLHLPRSLRIGGGVAKDDSKGLEIVERLIERADRLVPAVPGDFGELGVYDPEAIKAWVRQEIADGEILRAPDVLKNVDRSGPQGRTTETMDPSPSGSGPGEVSAQSGAPVLGDDATFGWTTYTLGSCNYEASAFNPGYWNNGGFQGYNNCYNYATNRRTDTFAQPGRASLGSVPYNQTNISCTNVGNAAKSDGCVASSTCVNVSLAPRHYVALVVIPSGSTRDYHWYRFHNDGFWGHKQGSTPAKNLDYNGNVIYNPQTAARGPYTQFCGYYYVGTNTQIS